ncbi:Uncharacterized protein GBIM_13949 [Gryllus bimaculatus]|nr:Uncharacterized protein GBIM_13949 [Gryllus bimaculatus]
MDQVGAALTASKREARSVVDTPSSAGASAAASGDRHSPRVLPPLPSSPLYHPHPLHPSQRRVGVSLCGGQAAFVLPVMMKPVTQEFKVNEEIFSHKHFRKCGPRYIAADRSVSPQMKRKVLSKLRIAERRNDSFSEKQIASEKQFELMKGPSSLLSKLRIEIEEIILMKLNRSCVGPICSVSRRGLLIQWLSGFLKMEKTSFSAIEGLERIDYSDVVFSAACWGLRPFKKCVGEMLIEILRSGRKIANGRLIGSHFRPVSFRNGADNRRPKPSVSWWRGERLLPARDMPSPFPNVQKSQLLVAPLSRSDLHSVFTCQAINSALTSPSSARVSLEMHHCYRDFRKASVLPLACI